eukprot:TRINITY_DN54744_c0_g1_i1.p1 TRINITY_DN54744_c0_g1~~TRINITY_DN54744_c0_g1_i1.p1  ORF type:complete len:1022 (+),score=121.94 TRINITY_DN54744_c0_g1_i1:51-3116(+)
MKIRAPVLLDLSLCFAPRVLGSNSFGQDSCRCVEWHNLDEYVSDGQLRVTIGGEAYSYPSNYGTSECRAWDQGVAPHCVGSPADTPDWCDDRWCYIDPNDCAGVSIGKSQYFPSKFLLYSYETCGAANTYDEFNVMTSQQVEAAMGELNGVVDSYLVATVRQTESAYSNFLASPPNATCSLRSLCESLPDQAAHWKYAASVDLSDVGVRFQDSVSPELSCTFQAAGSTFLKVAGKEQDADGSRAGYQYMGEMDSGNYLQWPLSDWCSDTYDPRLRPWYAAGSTSPKDVLIVVDVSGSMGRNGRIDLARRATVAILKTLSWADFASIILFNDGISNIYADKFVPATEDNVNSMVSWAESNIFQEGSTSFVAAFDRSFKLIEESVAASATSMCQKILLFLTDGQDPSFKDSDFRHVASRAKKLNVIVFTYALGSGADPAATHRLACENKGIFHNVPDGADLATIMSKYYLYFAAGQRKCSSATVRYTAFATKQEVYSSCQPVYKPDSQKGRSELFGVSCIDINIIREIETLKSTAGWDTFICSLSDRSKLCRTIDLTECHREALRAEVGPESVCVSEPESPCPCIDPTCTDDYDFTDDEGYFCDSWIGDDCTQATVTFGYSAEAQAEVIDRCPRSCGLCRFDIAHCGKATCKGRFDPGECRACKGRTSGLSLDGSSRRCPSGPTPYGVVEADENIEKTTKNSTANTTTMIIVFVCILAAIAVIGAIVVKVCLTRKSTKIEPAKPVVGAPAMVGHSSLKSASDDAPPLLPPQAVPRYWKNVSTTSFSELVVALDMKEAMQALIDGTFTKIKTRDRGDSALPSALRVAHVQRNENFALWQRYMERRAEIKAQRRHPCTHMGKRGGDAKTMILAKHLSGVSLGSDMDAGVNEVYLWHGTSPGAAQAITTDGFRIDLAGSHVGTMYGKGAYFAECSSKSDEYARDEKSGVFGGLHGLLLCRVVLGEQLILAVGGAAAHATIEQGLRHNLHNSVMGDREASVGTFREFVVYKADQIYPEFAVMYHREF